MHNDVPARFRKTECNRLSQPLGAAGHERDFPVIERRSHWYQSGIDVMGFTM
jgi:hypothetical protein